MIRFWLAFLANQKYAALRKTSVQNHSSLRFFNVVYICIDQWNSFFFYYLKRFAVVFSA